MGQSRSLASHKFESIKSSGISFCVDFWPVFKAHPNSNLWIPVVVYLWRYDLAVLRNPVCLKSDEVRELRLDSKKSRSDYLREEAALCVFASA